MLWNLRSLQISSICRIFQTDRKDKRSEKKRERDTERDRERQRETDKQQISSQFKPFQYQGKKRREKKWSQYKTRKRKIKPKFDRIEKDRLFSLFFEILVLNIICWNTSVAVTHILSKALPENIKSRSFIMKKLFRN